MAVIVGTNSYGDETGLAAFAALRGVTITGDPSVLLINGMDYIEPKIYKGNRYVTGQALEFPRTFYNFDTDESGVVPPDVITCQYTAALLVDAGNDLTPAVKRATKMERVEGAVTREYMDNASPTAYYPQLTALLSYYLAGGQGYNMAVDRA